jgi:hypothetical protein
VERHERALPLKVKPRTMLIQLGDWSRPGFFTRTRTGRGRQRAASSPAYSPPPLLARPDCRRLRPPMVIDGGCPDVPQRAGRPQDVMDGANGAPWHPATGQRPASVACRAYSRVQIRQRKRCQGRYPAIGWPGARVTGGELPAAPHLLEWCMACTSHVAWDDQLAGHHFGSGHPMAPLRVELTRRPSSRMPPGCSPPRSRRQSSYLA